MTSNEFEFQPTLRGRLIQLRPLLQADFEELYASASDPLIWEQHPQRDRYRREVFQSFFNGALVSGGAFAALEVKAGKIIGSSRYYDLRPEENRITIGYTFLSRPYWGGQFNREMKFLMLRHAFEFIETVLFEIGESNIRSQRAIERLGAHLFEKRDLDDQPHLVYRIDRADFLASIAASDWR